MTDKKKRFTPPSPALLVLIICLLAGIHWLVLSLRIPVLDNLPYWKYKLQFTPIDPIWILAACASLGLAWTVIRIRMNLALKLTALILLGTAIQYSFAFSKGQGLDGIRDRMVTAGHAEFARASVEQPGNMLWVLQNYEELAAKLRYGYFDSKPPGTFLFYLIFEQISNVIFPTTDHVERLENLRTFASWTWPLISYFVIIPLFFLARELFKDTESALLTCVLYLPVPSVTLITLHTDQVIYPLMAVNTVLLGAIAYRRDSFWLAVLCGASLYFAVYFSFGLAIVGVFLLLPVLTSLSNGESFTVRRIARYSAAILLGGILLHLPAAIFLKYDIATRYTNAWANHLNWKAWEDTLETYFKAGITNMVEFSVWIGLPLAFLFLANSYGSIHRLISRKVDPSTVFTTMLFGIFIFLLIFGKTKAEVARLWLFLVPFICVSVSSFIQRQEWSSRGKSIFAISTLLLEMGTTYFTVHYQDFS